MTIDLGSLNLNPNLKTMDIFEGGGYRVLLPTAKSTLNGSVAGLVWRPHVRSHVIANGQR